MARTLCMMLKASGMPSFGSSEYLVHPVRERNSSVQSVFVVCALIAFTSSRNCGAAMPSRIPTSTPFDAMPAK